DSERSRAGRRAWRASCAGGLARRSEGRARGGRMLLYGAPESRRERLSRFRELPRSRGLPFGLPFGLPCSATRPSRRGGTDRPAGPHRSTQDPPVRLKQIKLAGFKSFVDPTAFDVPSQLVGVVGPNGCG